MAVVEVTVTFAGTLLQITRVPHGRPVRVGRARDADVAVDVEPRTLPTNLARGERVEHALGLVRIALARIDEPAVPLARRALERRPLPFLALSAVVHVAFVWIAMLTMELDPITIPVDITSPPRLPPRIARIEAPVPAANARSSDDMPAATHDAKPTAGGFELLRRELRHVTGTADLGRELADAGPIYDEHAATAAQFGNHGRSFDPSSDPMFDSVKTGRYATVDSGRAAGASYRLPGEVERPPLMALACDDASCVVEGAFDRLRVRDIIEQRYVDLLKCYERTANSAPRVEITMRFEIDASGRPSDIAVDGHTAVGTCVARIVGRTKFPAADQPTRVRTYPMAFWRT